MYRKTIIVIAFLILTMFIGNAAASPRSVSDSYDKRDNKFKIESADKKPHKWKHSKNKKLKPSLGPYMTDEGSIAPKPNQTFGWNEKPYAFIQFDINDLNTKKPLFVWWKWRDPDGHVVSFERERITNFPEDNLNLWNSLDNWDVHKQMGEWTVETKWVNPSGGVGKFTNNFTVMPEPVSSILFLSGGAVLIARRYWKRKK